MSNQESRLAIVIDSSKAEQSVRRLRELLRGISVDGGRTSTDLGRLGDRSSDTSARIDRLNRSSAELNSTLGRLKGVMSGVFAGIGIGSIIKTADTMQSLDSQVKLVTSSMEQFNAVQSELRDIANRQYADIESLTQLYTRSQRALSNLGKSQREVLQFTENISMAMLVGGASAQEQAAALLQLSQALGSGVLAGEEFRSIAEQAPILLSLISKEMGVTRGELKKLASDGKITSEIIYNALISATDELTAQVALMPITVGQAFTVLKNNYKTFVGDFINSTTGLSGVVAGAIGVIAQNFDTLATVLMAGAAVWGVYALAGSAFVTTTIPALVLGIQTTIFSILSQSAAMQTAIASTFSLAAMQDFLTAATYRLQQARVVASLTLLNYKLLLLESIAVMQAKIASVAGAIAVQAQYALALATSGNLLAIFSLSVQGAAASLVAKASATVAATRAAAIYAASMIAIHNPIGAAVLGIRALTGMIIAKTGVMIAAIRQTSAYSIAIGGLGLAAKAATGAVSGLAVVVGRFGAIILAHPIMAIAAVVFTVTASTRGWQKAVEDVTDAIKVLGYLISDFVVDSIDAIKTLWNFTTGWFKGLMGGGNAATDFLAEVFGGWFEGTEGGFIGLLQVTARILDSMVKVVAAAVMTIAKGVYNLGVRVQNLAADMGNAIVDAFNWAARGVTSVLNSIGRGINEKIDALNSLPLVNIKARATVDWQPIQIDKMSKMSTIDNSFSANMDTAGIWTQLNGVEARLDKAIYKMFRDKTRRANEAAAGLLDATSAYEALGNAADEAGKKGKKATDKIKKGAKDAKEKIDKTAEAAKKLREMFDSAEAGLRKSIFMLDPQTNFSEWAYDLSDANNELSKLSDTSKAALMNLALQKDMVGFGKEMQGRAENLKREIELLNATNDLERERLKVQHELQDELKKYQSLKNAGLTTEYGEIKAALEAEAAGKKQLLHFQNLAAVSSEIEGVVNDLYKQAALLDNDSPIESLLYDFKIAGRLANATDEELEKLAVSVNKARDAYKELGQAKLASEMKKELGDLRIDLLGYGINETDSDKNDYQLADTLERLRQAHEMQLLQKDEFYKLSEIAEQRHADKMAEIENAMYQNRAGLFASASKALLGENSRMYRLLFAIEKGYALQSAWLEHKKSILKAYSETPGSVWAKAAAAAKAAADTGLMAAAIAAVQAPIGQAHDGIMSVPKSGTWNLEKGERVLPAHTAKAMDKKLEQGGKVIIHNHSGEKAEAKQDMDGNTIITIGKMVNGMIDAKMSNWERKAQRQGGILNRA